MRTLTEKEIFKLIARTKKYYSAKAFPEPDGTVDCRVDRYTAAGCRLALDVLEIAIEEYLEDRDNDD